MKKYLSNLPKEIKGLISLAAEITTKKGMAAYLVGGFVRDLILGVDNLDLDIVVEGDGIGFAEGLAGRLSAKIIRHKRFNTATITISQDLKIDIATARKEIYPEPASLPIVSSGTLRDDLKRRDFTINAMAIDISGRDFGKFIDFFHGREDLRHKKIGILHALSFSDDPTRILRAIRFAQRYNFSIEPKTLHLLKRAVKDKMLEKVEPQRVRDELILTLQEKQVLREIKMIKELAGFNFISPHLALSQLVYSFLRSIQKQINWFKKAYPERRKLDTWLIYLAGLIDSLDINQAKKVCKKFALRKGEEKRIISYKKITGKFIADLSREKIKPSRIFQLLEPLSYEVIILIKAKYKNRNIQGHIEDFFEIYNGMRIAISGDDLGRLGVAPSPYYKYIFNKVLRAKLEGKIKNREEELFLIKKFVKHRCP